MNWFVDSNGGNAVIMAVLLDEYPIPSILGFQSDERISAQMAWFAAPARPVVDFEDCRLEVFPMHFARDPWAVQIAQLRKSRPGSLFTIVFRVRDESILSGEVLALEEGILDLSALGTTLNVNILETGRVTDRPF